MRLRLIRKRECYRLTWFGRLLSLAFLLIVLSIFFFKVPVWLSQSKPVNGQILVLDGVMGDYAIEKAVKVFETGEYERIVVTGSDFPPSSFLKIHNSMAEYSYVRFLEMGFDSTKIDCLPTGRVMSNRTYTSAIVLRDWIKASNKPYNKIDVLSIGCHSARSRYLFQLAMDDLADVGVISIPNPSYDNIRWWRTSQGARIVISEFIGFIYVRFFFFP